MNNKTVFITGAATGIGCATAKKLDQMGWRVFAGVLPGQSTNDLLQGASKQLQAIEIDITNETMVAQAAATVKQAVGEQGLSALINNAAIADTGSGVLAGVSISKAQRMFEVNVWGTLKVIQHFLPLLHQYGPARMVNMSSGIVRVPVPTSGIYMMTKCCIDAMTRTLRMELAPFGIEVTAIEPGGVRTPMTDGAESNMEKNWAEMSAEICERYKPALSVTNKMLAKQLEDANEPEYIADGIIKALTRKNPSPRYMVGKEVKLVPMLQRLTSERLFESILLSQFGLKRGVISAN